MQLALRLDFNVMFLEEIRIKSHTTFSEGFFAEKTQKNRKLGSAIPLLSKGGYIAAIYFYGAGGLH